MRWLKTVAFVIVCSWFPVIPCRAQPSDADPFEEYERFLAEHQDMTSSDLLAMYPAGQFPEAVGLPWEAVQYHDLIDASCGLTADEHLLLERNGFVVTERLREESVVDQLLYIWRNDLPLFISTDAILHALGRSYDRIIRDVELGPLIDRLSELLARMHDRLPELDARYSADPAMYPMLRDMDVFLTVPRRLLGHDVVPHYPENASEVDELCALIDQERLAAYPLFSETSREIDFSQFTPRGHYTQHENLTKYFRAMVWLGRTEMYLSPPENTVPRPTAEDVQRQTIDAVLILELMDTPEAKALYDEIEGMLIFLVGEQDNLTAENLKTVVESLALADASALLGPTVLEAFQDKLAATGWGSQRILSQVLIQDPMTPEAVQPASAFLLFGQRFVIDAYVTGNVVSHNIQYQGNSICRLFPSTLDVLSALGNNVGMELLVPELDAYHYASNLAALRYLVDAHDTPFWDSSIYSMWLNAIRALNPPANRAHLPRCMQTAAWWCQKMNTQLAFWTELRHNNILYAKQSYTGGYPLCSYPSAYVEPFPEFFRQLRVLADASQVRFKDVVVSAPLLWEDVGWPETDLGFGITGYFDRFSSIMETLETIARKELEGTPLTGEEVSFMKEMLFMRTESVECYTWSEPDGWYADLLYGEDAIESEEGDESVPEYVVADYHTVPTDCAGNMTGWILHAGTGPIDLAIITVPVLGAETTAFVGPVMSYYEYTTTAFQRLTDEQWRSTYLPQARRPGWTSSYLTNEAGRSYDQ